MKISSKNLLIDPFGRQINYLRLSVTDRCNFRCVYCMSEEMEFLPKPKVLTLEELYLIGKAFNELGVTKIRLTGGEPLVRNDIVSLAKKLSSLPDLFELVMTTNGALLQHMAIPLKEAGVKRLNISIDSLDRRSFRNLTRYGNLEQVENGINAALDAGFEKIKLNSVIMNGKNHTEVIDLVNFAREKEIDISFIEEMPLGNIETHKRKETLMTSAELRDLITFHYKLEPLGEPGKLDGPSRYYVMKDSSSKIGFISPHSNNFCHLCNRVRVTAEGRLLLCLGHENSIDLRAIIRDKSADFDDLKQAIVTGLTNKPLRHEFREDQEPTVLRFMNATGG
ncbi:MAG: GTP 3',8-cyclase MoaA [Halieaceae bacterium]|nr:GTP 3',8-cyclase MoaA [Halieaceae bacterium]